MNIKYVLTNLKICPHKCLDLKTEDKLEFRINWQSHTLLMRSANMCVSRSRRSERHFLHRAIYRCECRLYPEAATPSGHLHITLYKIWL